MSPWALCRWRRQPKVVSAVAPAKAQRQLRWPRRRPRLRYASMSTAATCRRHHPSQEFLSCVAQPSSSLSGELITRIASDPLRAGGTSPRPSSSGATRPGRVASGAKLRALQFIYIAAAAGGAACVAGAAHTSLVRRPWFVAPPVSLAPPASLAPPKVPPRIDLYERGAIIVGGIMVHKHMCNYVCMHACMYVYEYVCTHTYIPDGKQHTLLSLFALNCVAVEARKRGRGGRCRAHESQNTKTRARLPRNPCA